MRFDAYVATFTDLDAHQLAEDVQAVVEDASGGVAMRWEPSSAKHGYAHAVALIEATDEKRRTVYAVLRYGGNAGTCNVEVKGEPSPAFAVWCRTHHPAHRVSRVDVCIDLSAPGLFDAGDRALTTISEEYRVQTRLAGDWKRAEAGRTLYLGAVSSDVRLRWYEKGKQLMAESVIGADPNHCRLEVTVKCRKLLKQLMASIEHSEVWGIADWCRAALEAVSGISADRIDLNVYRVPDHDRAIAWMIRQYGPRIVDEVARRGGWSQFGQHVEREVRRIQGITDRRAA